VRKSEYENGIAAFGEFLEKCPDHENVDFAHYWTGECYFATEQYPQAVEAFELVLNDYPNSAKITSATYKLARTKQELGDTEAARELFTKLVEEHSGTLEAEQARQRLDDM
jgi:tol-pal system protein YbgF